MNSHGVSVLLKHYVTGFQDGCINPRPNCKLLFVQRRAQQSTAGTILRLTAKTVPTPHDDYDLGYSQGFLTVEASSAIGGSDSSMNLYKLMTSGTFPEAFELTYGYPWDEAKHIIASVVSSNIFDIAKNISKVR